MHWLLTTLLLFTAGIVCAAVSVTDDGGTVITLDAPAARIISVAPHTTELLFAAGAGKALVGVSEFSDFPAEARHIRSVGGSAQLDLERIVQLRPDLVVAWKSGNAARQIARLRQLGIPVFESEPHDFEAIASGIERLAVLAGTDAQGKLAAHRFRQQLAGLRQRYAARPSVRAFYQIWPSPLMTLNHAHLVSQALKLCSAENVFGTLPQLVPTISMEAVIAVDPEVIFISDDRAGAGAMWQRFTQLKAVKMNTIFSVNGTLMNRAGPRILDGSAQLCEQVELARQRRKNAF